MNTNNIELAIIRQKYKQDGGGEQCIVSILEALKNYKIQVHIITRQWPNQMLNLNYKVHTCNPLIWNRLSREKNFAKEAIKYCQKKNLI